MLERFCDAHTHIYTGAGEYCGFLARMRDAGLEKAALLAITVHDGGLHAENNIKALEVKMLEKKTPVYVFGGVCHEPYLADIPFEKQAQALLAMGFDGIKFLEMKPQYRRMLGHGVDHPSYERLFDYLDEAQAPVVMHVNDPENFWDKSTMLPSEIERGWWYGDGTYPTNQQIYNEVFAVLDRHPGLNIVLPHFYFLSNKYDEAVRVMEKYPGVKFDLTPGWEMYAGFSKDIDRWRDFFIKYGDRILMGTDGSETRPEERQLDTIEMVSLALTHDGSEYPLPIHGRPVKGLDLEPALVRRISMENFERYFGSAPRAVDHAAVAEVADALRRRLADVPQARDFLETALACIKKY